MDFGQRLKAARLAQGRSRESVAAQAGITKADLCRLEVAFGAAPARAVVQVAACLEVPIDGIAHEGARGGNDSRPVLHVPSGPAACGFMAG